MTSLLPRRWLCLMLAGFCWMAAAPISHAQILQPSPALVGSLELAPLAGFKYAFPPQEPAEDAAQSGHQFKLIVLAGLLGALVIFLLAVLGRGIFAADFHQRLSGRTTLLLSSGLFVASVLAYMLTVQVRHHENPKDKVTPSVSQMADGFKRTAFEEDRKGDYRLLLDTVASAKRFGISLAFLSLAILLGLLMGLYPYVAAIFGKFVLFFDKIPALALLPILFIVFGLGEVSKIALILLGVFPTIALDTELRTRQVPGEQIVKAQTLGAGNFLTTFRVVLPQIMPGVLDTIRLNFKSMILFLIAGESLAATAGLGYRIFVVRRYIAMDIIIPYVIWMSLLALLADWLVRLFVQKRYRWAKA